MQFVFPKCKSTKHLQTFVNAEGFLFPCCWIAIHATKDILQSFLGADYDLLNLNIYTVQEIMKSEAWRKIEQSWEIEHSPLNACKRYCGKPYDENDHQTLAKRKYFRVNSYGCSSQ